jgi:hypothetical protein
MPSGEASLSDPIRLASSLGILFLGHVVYAGSGIFSQSLKAFPQSLRSSGDTDW